MSEQKKPTLNTARCYTSALVAESFIPFHKLTGALESNFQIGEPVKEDLQDGWSVLTLGIEVNVQEADSSQPAFKVVLRQCLLYQALNIPKEEQRSLQFQVLPNIILPYLGAKLTQTVTDMGYPPLSLPVLSFGPPAPEPKQATKDLSKFTIGGAKPEILKLH